MKKNIVNMTRHELTLDQIQLLEKANLNYDPFPLAPSFVDSLDFFTQMEGKSAILVVPLCFILDALKMAISCMIVNFMPSAEARKAGKFATDRMYVYEIISGQVFSAREYKLEKYTQAVNFEAVNK